MGEVIPAIPDTLSYLQRVPVGVCAIITPWNVPFLMMVSSLTPALAVGNTCVLKPASINSLISIILRRVFWRLFFAAVAFPQISHVREASPRWEGRR